MISLDPHPAFQLNGNSYSKDDLIELAYSYIKEGESYENEIGDFLLDWLNDNDYVRVNTSGSMGSPKAILLTKLRMVNSARATGAYFNLKPGSTALHCLPTKYIAGKMMLVRAMVLGLKIDCIEPTSHPLKNCELPYDFCAMVPLQLQNSLGKLDGIRTLIIGGAPFSYELKQKVSKTKCSIYETFGMTETITHIAVKSVNRPPEPNFRTLPNITVSKNNRDCLVISAPNISDKDIVTNDLVNFISNTEFEWLGRFDTVINSGGIKLIPEVLEVKLAAFIENRFFVTGVPDKKLGEKLILIVEGELNKVALVNKIASDPSIEKFERPKEIYFLPKFVETDNGKIRRNETISLIVIS